MMNNKYIIITGASSGIGKAIAIQAAKNGFNLILSGRNSANLDATTKICKEHKVKVINVYGDITDSSIQEKIIDAVKNKKELFALVNSAGIGRFGDPANLSDEMLDEMFNVNVKAMFSLSREVIKIKNGKNFLNIINISSDCDNVAFPDATAYCATKGGVLMMSKAFGLAVRKDNVRVTCISPGRVDTYFNNKKPGMRIGALMPEEVAEVVMFAITAHKNIELQEIRIDSMSRTW
ncbi:SDR family oxidoreductase [Candidatus Peregrinibacteria bacterium]|nr:SDR family oxidoreductase [Candidatus Peregrinibacteria bacterium]